MPRQPRPRSLRGRKPGSGLRAEVAAPPAPNGLEAPRGNFAPNGPAGRLPLEVTRQAQREMDRLRRLPPGSPEAAHVRAYLQWLWSMPWERATPEDADLKRVETVLERDHLALPKAKERIVEFLAVRRLKPDLPGPALCLVGPPGTGKTSLGAAMARALQRPFVRINVSGTSDAGEIKGVNRGLPGAQPGKLVRAVREAGVKNPVLMIDGVDRLVGEGGLGVCEALLELLDTESSAHFVDHYLGLPCDLSRAVLLLCANVIDNIPDILLERIEVIEVPGYSEDEKLEIARRYLIPRQLHDHGLSLRDVALADETVRAMVRHYTLEAGVRSLARQIATVCRKVARSRATGVMKRHRVGPRRLHDYLGHRLYSPESVGKEAAQEPGKAAHGSFRTLLGFFVSGMTDSMRASAPKTAYCPDTPPDPPCPRMMPPGRCGCPSLLTLLHQVPGVSGGLL